MKGYVFEEMLAQHYGVSAATISRHVKAMEETGRYPTAVMRIGKIRVDFESFDHFEKTKGRTPRGRKAKDAEKNRD